MKENFGKSNYRPRYKGYRIHKAFVIMLDGFLSLIVGLFGYDCYIYSNWCADQLKKDVIRAKAEREERKRKYYESKNNER